MRRLAVGGGHCVVSDIACECLIESALDDLNGSLKMKLSVYGYYGSWLL